MQTDLVASYRLDDGEDDREELRAAAGHNRVDRNVLDGYLSLSLDVLANNLVAGTARGGHGLSDLLRRWRHDRQPIGPPLVIAKLDQVSAVIHLY
jgi:hypothetical protein